LNFYLDGLAAPLLYSTSVALYSPFYLVLSIIRALPSKEVFQFPDVRKAQLVFDAIFRYLCRRMEDHSCHKDAIMVEFNSFFLKLIDVFCICMGLNDCK